MPGRQTISTTARTPATPGGTAYVRRKCACGGSAGPSGECEECGKKKRLGLQRKLTIGASNDPLEREADQVADQVMAGFGHHANAVPRRIQRFANSSDCSAPTAPASISHVLSSPGSPLAPAVRRGMEHRFGHDFSKVRIHRDGAAAASARDIAARAYTVGNHVVFGAGSYAPETREGGRLIAHELAHVVQQQGMVQRDSISPEPGTRTSEEDEEAPRPESMEEESEEVVVRRAPIGPDSDLAADAWPEKTEAAEIRAETQAMYECLKTAGCKPSTPLTWANFRGRLPANHRFEAVTVSDLRLGENPVRTCMSATAAAAAANPRGIEAFIDQARSAVKQRAAQPTNMAVNGCQRRIRECVDFFRRQPPGSVGATFALTATPDPRCPAGILPRGDTATSAAECTTVVGADCRDREVAESLRLLRHEQGHFDLTCAIARKANRMIESDTNVEALLRAARRVLNPEQARYDSETSHGCLADEQANWEADIANGLPDVTLEITAADRRPRGGRRRRRR